LAITWTFDATGYVLGTAAILYGCYAKRFKGRPKSVGRWVWIVIGIVAIAINIGQNIIEFQDL
jgi:hypothetical protein